MPDIDLDLSLTNVWWTLMFLAGSIACLLHTHRTWDRWRATRASNAPRGIQIAAFWFLRQNIGNDVLGIAMFLAGFCAVARWNGPHVIWLIQLGALAYAINKVWNILQDGQIEEFAEELAAQRAVANKEKENRK